MAVYRGSRHVCAHRISFSFSQPFSPPFGSLEVLTVTKLAYNFFLSNEHKKDEKDFVVQWNVHTYPHCVCA